MIKDPVKKKAARRRNYLRYRTARIKYSIEYRNKLSEEEKAKKNARRRERRRLLREAVLDKYGRCCNECGFSNPFALQVDHVHGGGTKERKTVPEFCKGSSNKYLLDILEDTTGKYQLLCANCNVIKHWTSATESRQERE